LVRRVQAVRYGVIVSAWRSIVLLGCLALAGCGHGFHDQLACRRAAGQEPSAALPLLFGLVGTVIQASDPAHADWQRSVNACLRDRQASIEP